MEACKNFIAEKRRYIVLGSLLTGASLFAYHKVRNITHSAEGQLKSKDVRLRTYFEESQQTITSIVQQQVPCIYERLANLLEIPQPQELRNCATKEEKIVLWESLQIQSFTRAVTAVYSIVLLTTILRIQINLVGRYIHKDQVELGSSQSPSSAPLFDDTIQEKYLSYSDYVVTSGLERLSAHVRSSTHKVLSDWPLTRIVTFEDMLHIFLSIRANAEHSLSTLLDTLLPPENTIHLDENDEILGMLLGETRNILEGPSFHSLFKKCLDYAFLQVTQHLRLSFVDDSTQPDSNDAQQSTSDTPTSDSELTTYSSSQASTTSFQLLRDALITMPMAKVIPVVRLEFNYTLQTPTSEVVSTLSHFPPLQHYSYSIFTTIM